MLRPVYENLIAAVSVVLFITTLLVWAKIAEDAAFRERYVVGGPVISARP